MKTIYVSVAEDVRKTDTWSSFSFDFDELFKSARDDYERLSDHDKKEVVTVYVTMYKIEIPDEYTGTDADELMRDLFNGDVECEQYNDLLAMFDDPAIIRQVRII